MERDRLGRRRTPDQGRGLQPMHPPLPDEWDSRVLRVAMSGSDWERFDAMSDACAPVATTQARANGLVLSSLLRSVPAPAPGPRADSGALDDWLEWERRKALRLLPVKKV